MCIDTASCPVRVLGCGEGGEGQWETKLSPGVIENSIEDRLCDALSWVFSTFKKGCSNNTEM